MHLEPHSEAYPEVVVCLFLSGGIFGCRFWCFGDTNPSAVGDLLSGGGLREFRRDSAAVNRLSQAHPEKPNESYWLQRRVAAAM